MRLLGGTDFSFSGGYQVYTASSFSYLVLVFTSVSARIPSGAESVHAALVSVSLCVLVLLGLIGLVSSVSFKSSGS